MTNEQHASRPYINLDWADVEAWVKSNPRTERNRYGGYYTSCPVPEHKTNDRIGVWKDDDGIHLKCYGGCTHRAMLEAIDNAINNPDQPTPPPQVAPPPTAEPLTAAAIEAHWPAVLELLGQWRNITALLRDARVAAVQANDITLEFPTAFHAGQIEKPENRLLTEKALQRELGRPLRVRAAVNPEKEIKPSTAPETKDQYAQELEQAMAAAQAKHAQELERAVATAQAGHALELEQAVAAAKAERDQERAAREATETERDEAHDARQAAETERKQEHDARVAAEAKISQLETQLENNLVPATSKDAEIKKLRSRIKGLRGGAARARLEERAKNEGCIENLKQKLADTTGQHSQELATRDSRINEIEKELGESRRKVLTFEFLATWCGLEKKLKSLNRELIQDGQRTVVANQLRRAYEKGSINDQQLMNLDNMRAQRDDVVHNALLLTTSQARAHLGILKQVIEQL